MALARVAHERSTETRGHLLGPADGRGRIVLAADDDDRGVTVVGQFDDLGVLGEALATGPREVVHGPVRGQPRRLRPQVREQGLGIGGILVVEAARAADDLERLRLGVVRAVVGPVVVGVGESKQTRPVSLLRGGESRTQLSPR